MCLILHWGTSGVVNDDKGVQRSINTYARYVVNYLFACLNVGHLLVELNVNKILYQLLRYHKVQYGEKSSCTW